MALRLTCRLLLSVCVALVFAFSATWWKFSTDANAYVPATTLLTICAWLTLRREGGGVWPVAILHALAMLLHQIAIWFYPAMWTVLWFRTHRRGRDIAVYTMLSATLVTAAYVSVWFGVLDRGRDPAGFVSWLTFNGGDVLSKKPVIDSGIDIFRSSLKLFFGGRVSLALRHWSPAALAIALAALAGAIVSIFRWASRRPASRGLGASTAAMRTLIVWAAAFLFFLAFWLTEYPYYKLFCLPPLVLLGGAALAKRHARGVPAYSVARALVVVVAVLNFTMYIYPYSRPESSPPLHMALGARSLWTQPVTVYFEEFTCDNWWMKYFNMHTHWRKASVDRHHRLQRDAREAIDSGHRVFLDTSLWTRLESASDARRVLEKEFHFSERFSLIDGKHHIRFVELHARPR